MSESDTNKDTINKNMTSIQSICPTKVIEDIPAEFDMLTFHEDLGPHERVAKAMSDLILSPDETGGKIIGLEGGWGAGKTTVINLLRKQLAVNEKITVFLFGAWSHEGDPLRRTYLESLIRHFQDKKWINKKDWDNILDKLAKRRRVTSTRTVPKTTLLGKLFAISVLLVPLGGTFLAKALRDGITFKLGNQISYLFVIGLLFSLAPFIVLNGNSIRIVFSMLKNGENSSTQQSNDDKELTNWAFLSGKAITETVQETSETPEPTSIEFENDFFSLMNTALPPDSKRQAVIILDNLDRIDSKDTLSIWATLQTFMYQRGSISEPWFNNLWIIVPYDPAGLRQVWENRKETKQSSDKQNIDNESTEQYEPQNELSDSFIDKSFQLRFEVPPPVLSNWKTFLTNLVAEALPEHSEEDQQTIYRVFNLCRVRNGYSPTPRELKLYVNQIGVYHRQWQHEFPLGHIAYYVILRRQHKEIRKDLLSGKLPDPKIESILSSRLGANLSGLVFNVKADLGQQLLLGDPIKLALEENDTEKLNELQKHHDEGFWAVIEEVASSWKDNGNASNIVNIASSLNELDNFKDKKRKEIKTLLIELKAAAINIENWSPFEQPLFEGIALICELTNQIETSKTILRNLKLTFEKTDQQDLPIDTAKILTDGSIKVCEQLIDLVQKDAIPSNFILPLNTDTWIEICSHIKLKDPKWWKQFKPKVTFNDIIQFIIESVKSGEFSESQLNAIHITQRSFKKCNWNSLSKEFEQRMDASQDLEISEAKLLFAGLQLLEQNECTEAKAALKRFADGGHLMHYLHKGDSQNDEDFKSLCFVMFIEQRPEAEKPQNIGNSEAGYDVFDNLLKTDELNFAPKVINLLKGRGNLNLLIEIVEKRGQYDPLILRCLRSLADSDLKEEVYSSEIIIDRWQQLIDNLHEEKSPDRFENLIEHFGKNSSLLEELMISDEIFQKDHAKLYLIICRVCPTPDFSKWCQKGLDALNIDDWKSELQKDGDNLNLLMVLCEQHINIKLKQPFQDAITEHAKTVSVGKIKPSESMIEQCPLILSCVSSESALNTLRRQIREIANNLDGKCTSEFFEMYGDLLKEHKILAENSNIIFKLFSPLVKERNIGGLNWLLAVFNDFPGLLDGYTDSAAVDSIRDLRERLKGEFEKSYDDNDEAHKLIMDLAQILGIEPQKDDLESEDDDSEDSTDETEQPGKE